MHRISKHKSSSSSGSSKTLLLLLLLLIAIACPHCCSSCSNTSGLPQQPLVGPNPSTPLQSPLRAAALAAALAVSASSPPISSSSSSSGEAFGLPGKMALEAAAFASRLRGALPVLPAAAAACGRRSWLASPPGAAAAATTRVAAAADCFAEEEGVPGTESFRIYFKRKDGRPCSPWHHIHPFPQQQGVDPGPWGGDDPSEAQQQNEAQAAASRLNPEKRYTPGGVAAAAERAAAAAAAGLPVAAAFKALSPSTAATAAAAAGGLLIRYVAEIALGSSAKNEIVMGKPWNPIQQVRNADASLRFLRWPMAWSYGSIPQTWADPSLAGGPEVFGLGGDDDPLDVVEVSRQQHKPGAIVDAKVIGGLCLIDSGEVDLKVLVVSVGSPLLPLLHSPADLERLRPGFLSSLKAWFASYKDPDNPNAFGCKGAPLGPLDTWDLILQARQSYRDLCSNPHAAPKHLWMPPRTKAQ
ncbi:hypothetical protein Esti_004994 [Eimeria stiedai]